MQTQDRTDRILILVALAIFILASGLFYFDSWMWGGRSGRAETIGKIDIRYGDVRVKFDGDLRWSQAINGQDLTYNDSIYAGSDSQASVLVGQSEMTVSENSLVVLRREENVNFMTLAYGSLTGKIGKSEKVVIDTGDGKPIELSSREKTKLVVRKDRNGHTELEIKSGSVDVVIAGKKTQVGKDTRISMDPKSTIPKIEKIELELIKPKSTETVYSERAARLDFAWRWSNYRRPAARDKYTLEFSNTPDFERLVSKKEVSGTLSASMTVSESVSLYYHVRGPNGEISPTEKVNFVRLHQPLILKPVANSRFPLSASQKTPVEIEFNRPPRASVWFQISSDPNFASTLIVESTNDIKLVRELAGGRYFIRAKSDFGGNHESSWTLGIPFTVEQAKEGLNLGSRQPPARILIPNRSYPKALYRASRDKVEDYLARHGFMRDFFPLERSAFDRLNLKFADEVKPRLQQHTSWPKDKIYPAEYSYHYLIEKQGYDPSAWSAAQKLEISMEPPRPEGDPQYGERDRKGEREVRWSFTPLLFARSYDVQLAKNPQMSGAKEWRVPTPEAKASVAQESYWRTRARDRQGRIISDWSRATKLTPPLGPIPIQARQPQPRKPAAIEQTAERVERIREKPFEKSGWWSWFGMGGNFVDYSQSNKGIGTLNATHVKGPSQYFEFGFLGKNHLGGVFSSSRTPGEINPELHGSTIDTTTYTWTTMSLEAILQRSSPFTLLGSPVVYGLRLGAQQHQLPYAHINYYGNVLLKSNTSTNGSAGILAEWSRRRWTYYWLMRYQYPFSTSAEGSSQFSVNPVFSFDGSIGTAYNFTRQLKAGLFWNGQWHQFNFTYSDGTVTNNGFQSLFYSNLDFRLGWDF